MLYCYIVILLGIDINIAYQYVKPSNILIDDNEMPVLSDFECCFDATILQQLAHSTKTSGVIGTFKYWAPELTTSASLVQTRATDMYAVGKILAEFLSTFQQQNNPQYSSFLTFPWLDSIIQRLTNGNPANRPSAQSVLDELQSEDEKQLNRALDLKQQTSEMRIQVTQSRLQSIRQNGRVTSIKLLRYEKKMAPESRLSGDSVSSNRVFSIDKAFEQLQRVDDFTGVLKVEFEGEAGVDAGGLKREFYQTMLELSLSERSLFDEGGDNKGLGYLLPKKDVNMSERQLMRLKVVGCMMGKCLLDRMSVDVLERLPLFLYRVLLSKDEIFPGYATPSIAQLVTVQDFEMFMGSDSWMRLQSLQLMGEAELKSVDLAFDELKAGGDCERVSGHNVSAYISLKMYHDLIGSRAAALGALWQGFHHPTLTPVYEAVKLLDAEELCVLLAGEPYVDVRLCIRRRVIVFLEFPQDSVVPELIKSVLTDHMTTVEVVKWLRFVTASNRLPFNASEGYIECVYHRTMAVDSLPVAQTCFCRIDIPRFTRPTVESVKRKLLQAIEYAGDTFGLC